jgi:hypothetical protein
MPAIPRRRAPPNPRPGAPADLRARLPIRRLKAAPVQPFIHVSRLADGREQLWLAEVDTASLASRNRAGPTGRNVGLLTEVAGDQAFPAEIIFWAVIVPQARAALLLSEQQGGGPDYFVDFNVRLAPFDPGGPSLFMNEHSVNVSKANVASALFAQFQAEIAADMASHGATQAEIDAELAAMAWAAVPDQVQWAPRVSLLDLDRLAVTFQLDIVETGTYGWLGEERFTGTWSGLRGQGPLSFEGWSASSAGTVGPDSGPPLPLMIGNVPLTPGPERESAPRQLKAGGRAIRPPASAVLPGVSKWPWRALMAHGRFLAPS